MPISTFPPNVRRWLKRSVQLKSPVPNRIMNTQEGEMDIRGKWTPFTARTIYRRNPFSFLWNARFRLMPGVWLKAEDGHDTENGWGDAKLWGVFPMGGRKGTGEVFAMQAVRSLAELPWKPHFAFELPQIKWDDIDDNAFEVNTSAGKHDITIQFHLNEEDQIVRASGKRHYDVRDGFVEASWHYNFSDHRDLNGILMPCSAVATYEKPDGPWEYWRGKIVSVEMVD